MSDDMPPDWAIERALELGFTGTRLEDVKRHWPGHTAHIAFARYIAAHEEPPVDEAHEATKRALRDAYGGAAPEFVSAFKTALAFEGFQVTKIVEAAQ